MTRSDDDPLGWPEAAAGNSARATVSIHTARLVSQEAIVLPAPGVTVVVGANNAGKSTFLRQVNTWLQSGPTALHSMSPRLVDHVALDRQLSKNDLIHWLSEQAVLMEGAPINGGDYFAIAGTNVYASAVRQGQFETNHGWLPDLYAPMVFFADATSRLSFPFSSQARSEVDEPASTPLQRFQDRRDLFESLSRLSERVFGNPLTLDDFAGATIRIRVGSVDSTPPARNEPLGEFGRAIARLPLLDAQGDGMRSFFGLMIPVLAGAQQIIVVDEPEAFLHPPQARALGRELAVAATARGAQVLVATHDKDFISGVLDAQSDLSIVRLSRDGSTTTRTQPSADRLRHLRDDRLLRHSNVLNGLFARLVVLCEGDQDCRFYEAALDHYVNLHAADSNVHSVPVSEVLFIPVNGKGGFGNFISSLKELSVPTVIVPDIDLLRSREQTRSLYELLGGIWDDVARDYDVTTASRRRVATLRKPQAVLDAVTGVLQPLAETSPDTAIPTDVRDLVDAMLAPSEDPWADAKKSGVQAFAGDEHSSLTTLMSKLDGRGIVLVQVGELERFAPNLAKNKAWLPNAIEANAHTNSGPQDLIGRIMQFHSQTLM